MKSLRSPFTGPFAGICAGMLLAAVLALPSHAKPAPSGLKRVDSLTQTEVGIRAIQGILRESPIDSIARFFDEGALENLTAENLSGFRGQISWLPRFIGDSLEVLMTGSEVPDSAGRTAFFREYRFANEANKRAPLMVVHLYFSDSTSTKVLGAYNKTFDDDTRNRIGNAEIWETPAGKIDVHSVTYIEINGKVLPIIRVFDEDTLELDSARAVGKAAPAAREALARGYLEQIRKAQPGLPLMYRVGVSLIRRDPHRGYQQLPVVLSPASYGGPEDPEAAPVKPKAKKKAK
jgi:hypothetical protein